MLDKEQLFRLCECRLRLELDATIQKMAQVIIADPYADRQDTDIWLRTLEMAFRIDRSLFLDLFFIRCCGVGMEVEEKYMLIGIGWPYRFINNNIPGFNELMKELWQKHTGNVIYSLLCKVANEVKE